LEQQDNSEYLTLADIEWLLVTSYVYLQNGHLEKCIAMLELVISLDRNNFDALKQLCYAYLQAGRYRETLLVCEKLYNVSAGSDKVVAPVYLIHSCALLHLDKKDQAKDWLAKYQSFLGK